MITVVRMECVMEEGRTRERPVMLWVSGPATQRKMSLSRNRSFRLARKRKLADLSGGDQKHSAGGEMDGIYSVTFRGAVDWGVGMLLLLHGRIVGADVAGILFDGT